MAKKLDFDKEKNNRNDNAIEEIMQAEFPLPKQAEDAKNEAFSRIREMAAASGHTEIQRIWCKDYRRNQQKNQQEVPERNPQEQQNRTRNSKQYTKQLWD